MGSELWVGGNDFNQKGLGFFVRGRMAAAQRSNPMLVLKDK
jgi:hypothetical protein